jgi:outer membrane protein assembly factor BamB
VLCRALLSCLAVIAAPHIATGQQSSAIWTHGAGDTVRSIIVTGKGSVAVRTARTLTVLDAATGRPVWSRRDFNAARIVSAEHVLVEQGTTQLVDLETGATVWSFVEVQGIDLRSFVQVPERRELLVGYGVGDSFVVSAVGVDSGTMRWRRTDWLPDSLARQRGHIATQPPLCDSDSTLILYSSHLGVIRVDARTGAILWRSSAQPGAHVPNVNEGQAPMMVDEGQLFVPHDEQLLALDQATGRMLWNRAELPAAITHLTPTPLGLLVSGRTLRVKGPRQSFVDLVERGSGTSVWPQPYRRDVSSSNPQLVGNQAFMAFGGRLLKFDLASGVVRDSMKIRFEGGEHPQSLERQGEHLILTSSQNIMSVSLDGVIRFHVYHPAPRAVYVTKRLSSRTDEALSLMGSFLSGGYVYQPPTLAVSRAVIGNPALGPRARTTAASDDFQFLVTRKDALGKAPFSFVRIDKRDGTELGRVRIDDKSPRFVIDAATGTVLLYGGSDEQAQGVHRIKAYRFSSISGASR